MDESVARERLGEERRRMEAELASLRAQMRESEREAAGELGDVNQHGADVATELSMRMDDERRIEDLEGHLAAIGRAEARLDAGTYGRSVASGVPIPDARLRAIPWADLTVEEERAREAAGGAAVMDPDAGVPHPEGDDRTPLDTEEPAPPGISPSDAIDLLDGEMSGAEVDDEIEVDAPGEVYEGESGAPHVGEDEPTDEALRRRYRPG